MFNLFPFQNYDKYLYTYFKVDKGEAPFYAVPAKTWFTRLVEEKHADKTRFSVYR